MHISRFFGLLLCVMLALIPAQAQTRDEPAPVVFLRERQLWLRDDVTGAETQLTDAGRVWEFAISPVDALVVYTLDAPITTEALAREGGIGGGWLPTDVALLNLATGDVRIISAQPEDASFFTPSQPDTFYAAGYPQWSLDGETIAWTEYRAPEDMIWLGVYSLGADATSQVLLDMPPVIGVPGPLPFAWDGGLVALLNEAFVEGAVVTAIFFFDLNGTLVQRVPVDGSAELPLDSESLAWVDGDAFDLPGLADDQRYLYAESRDRAIVIDPASGALFPVDPVPGAETRMTASDCPDLPAAVLRVGQRGQVVRGYGANNLRAQAARGAANLGSIPEGGIFAVLDGPRCAEGLRWWRVDYNGLIGWTADGQGSTRWLMAAP